MPIVYASGTPNSDGYLSGISVATSSSLLSNIRDYLTSAGWTVNSSQIAAGKLNAVGVDGEDNCWINFSLVNTSGNQYNLHIRGDLDGTGVNLSPDTITIPYSESLQARLYLSVDSAGGCIFIQNGAAGGESAFFGFLHRLTDSPYSWMVGKLRMWEDTAYMARDIWSVDWAQMSKYWFEYNSITNAVGAKQHLWDGYTVAMMPRDDFSDRSSSANSKINPAYRPWYGAVDSITNLPILSDYGYLIGKNDNKNDYYSTDPNLAIPLHFPGRVRFARTGLASVDAGDQFVVGSKVVISGGAIGQYQGFVIADSAA